MKTFSEEFLDRLIEISYKITPNDIENMAKCIHKTKINKGNLFIIGVGGSASNSSHSVNDFRKICEINAFSPFDNVSEITARINDDGWDNSIVGWMRMFFPCENDVLLVYSVGGGSEEKNVSVNIINAIKFAKSKRTKVLSIVGKKDGYAYYNSDVAIHIPSGKDMVTPYTESFHSIISHLLVSHPLLQQNQTKWESLE